MTRSLVSANGPWSLGMRVDLSGSTGRVASSPSHRDSIILVDKQMRGRYRRGCHVQGGGFFQGAQAIGTALFRRFSVRYLHYPCRAEREHFQQVSLKHNFEMLLRTLPPDNPTIAAEETNTSGLSHLYDGEQSN